MALLPEADLTASSLPLRQRVAEEEPLILAASCLPALVAAVGADSGVLWPAGLLILQDREIVVEPGCLPLTTGPAVEVAQVHPAETELQLHLAMAEQEFHLLYQVQQ